MKSHKASTQAEQRNATKFVLPSYNGLELRLRIEKCDQGRAEWFFPLSENAIDSKTDFRYVSVDRVKGIDEYGSPVTHGSLGVLIDSDTGDNYTPYPSVWRLSERATLIAYISLDGAGEASLIDYETAAVLTGGGNILFCKSASLADVETCRRLLSIDPEAGSVRDKLVNVGRFRDPQCGWTGLHYASLATNADVVNLLLDAGHDPNVRAANRSTPLHVAAWRGRLECVLALCSRGADPTIFDRAGKRPIDCAANDIVRDALAAGTARFSIR